MSSIASVRQFGGNIKLLSPILIIFRVPNARTWNKHFAICSYLSVKAIFFKSPERLKLIWNIKIIDNFNDKKYQISQKVYEIKRDERLSFFFGNARTKDKI